MIKKLFKITYVEKRGSPEKEAHFFVESKKEAIQEFNRLDIYPGNLGECLFYTIEQYRQGRLNV